MAAVSGPIYGVCRWTMRAIRVRRARDFVETRNAFPPLATNRSRKRRDIPPRIFRAKRNLISGEKKWKRQNSFVLSRLFSPRYTHIYIYIYLRKFDYKLRHFRKDDYNSRHISCGYSFCNVWRLS